MRVIGFAHIEEVRRRQSPLLTITWHGRLLVPTWYTRKLKLVAMISQHRDGELVARVVENIGYDTVRGSSTRGGVGASLEMIARIRSGQIGAMICDGPRGPIYKMKPGAAHIAINSGAAVIPVIASARSAWTFRSWDRFTVPKPFARVFLLYGEPIPFPGEDTDTEKFSLLLENRLNDLLAEADEMSGSPIPRS